MSKSGLSACSPFPSTSVKGVRICPGRTPLTRILTSPPSPAAQRVKASTPALETEYEAGTGDLPKMLFKNGV